MYSNNVLLELVKLKPPLVVFYLSSVAFVISFGALSLYLKQNKDHIPSYEVKSISSFRYCVNKSVAIDKELPPTTDLVSTLVLSVKLKIFKLPKKNVTVSGTIKASDLVMIHNDYLTATFTVPGEKVTDDEFIDACVTLSGPLRYLPNLSPADGKCKMMKPSKSSLKFIPESRVDECPAGTLGSFWVEEEPSLNVYLTEGDAKLIEQNMAVVVLGLMSLIVLSMFWIICCRLCCGKNSIEMDKVPLVA